MPSTLPATVDPRHRKSCAEEGESLRKKLAGLPAGPNWGRVLTRAFALAGLAPKDVAFRLGYQDQSSVSRWLNNSESPNLPRLLSLRELRGPMVIALAEATDGLSVQTVVTLRAESVA
jgi:hypothetical protein